MVGRKDSFLALVWVDFIFSNLLLIISWHFLVVAQHFPNATQCPLVSPWHYLMYPWHSCWPRMSSYYLSFFSLTSPQHFPNIAQSLHVIPQHLPNFPPKPKIYTFLNPHPLGNIVFFYGHASTQCPQTSPQHYPSSQTSLDVFLTFPPCQEKIMDAVLVIVEHGQNVSKPFQNISNQKNSKDTLFKTSLKSQNHPWDIHTKWAIGNLGIKYSPMTIVMYSKLVIWLLIALIQIHQIALVQVISLELFLFGHMRTHFFITCTNFVISLSLFAPTIHNCHL